MTKIAFTSISHSLNALTHLFTALLPPFNNATAQPSFFNSYENYFTLFTTEFIRFFTMRLVVSPLLTSCKYYTPKFSDPAFTLSLQAPPANHLSLSFVTSSSSTTVQAFTSVTASFSFLNLMMFVLALGITSFHL